MDLPSPADALSLPPDQLLTLLSAHSAITPEYNWLLLGEGAAFLAHRSSDDKARLSWAEISVIAYQRDSSDSATHSSMMLRASMIKRLGHTTGHPVLDGSLLEKWFFDFLHDDLSHIRNIIPVDLSSTPLATLQYLREIKNRLNIIRLLAETPYLAPNAEVREWLSIARDLP